MFATKSRILIIAILNFIKNSYNLLLLRVNIKTSSSLQDFRQNSQLSQ